MSESFSILCLETSSQICSVSVVQANGAFHVSSERVQNHAEVLMDLIQQAMDKASIGMQDLSAIALSDGPGSYTGLRIGSSTAKGLCFALQIPLIKVSTLEALAKAVSMKTHKAFIWPMIDARRMEVYHSIYNPTLKCLQAPNNGIVDMVGFVPDWLDLGTTVICGDGGKKAADYLSCEFIDVQPNSAHLSALAVSAFEQRAFVDTASYEPFYLKQANITMPSKKL